MNNRKYERGRFRYFCRDINNKIRKDNTSGIKGVSWHKRVKKWVALCQTNGKQKHLGSFDTIEEAEKVVKEFREKQHKEFTNHG